MYPAMNKRMKEIGVNRFADGVVGYTPTVGNEETRKAFLNILQAEGIDTSNIYPKYLKLNRNKKEFPLDILIAGDSRAERQIIPEMLKGKNQKNILNLAITSGDVNRLRDFISNRIKSEIASNIWGKDYLYVMRLDSDPQFQAALDNFINAKKLLIDE